MVLASQTIERELNILDIKQTNRTKNNFFGTFLRHEYLKVNNFAKIFTVENILLFPILCGNKQNL